MKVDMSMCTSKLTGVILSVLNESTLFFDLLNSFSANFSHCDTDSGLTYVSWVTADENRVVRMEDARNAVDLQILACG